MKCVTKSQPICKATNISKDLIPLNPMRKNL